MNFYNLYFGNTESKIFFFIIFFLGLTFGWFFRKGNIFWMIVATLVFAPLLEIIMKIDDWFFTLPFVLGFLVHTAKPIYRKIMTYI